MATIPYVFQCSKDAGFVMNPNEQKRFGYVTALKGLNSQIAEVWVPKTSSALIAPASVALAALG